MDSATRNRNRSSTVYIAHVIPLGTYIAARPQSFDAIEKECREHAQAKLNEFSAGITSEGVPVQTLLTKGDVGVVLPEWIKRYNINLVAVGTTGRSGIRKLALGSTAEEIIRAAECPVLTVGPASTAATPVELRSILYATDFSADSIMAAAYAFSIAGRHHARHPSSCDSGTRHAAIQADARKTITKTRYERFQTGGRTRDTDRRGQTLKEDA